MNYLKILPLIFVGLWSVSAHAINLDGKRISIAYLPYFQDEYSDMGAYAETIFDDEDDKYQFQVNIINDLDTRGFMDLAESSEYYWSLRRAKFHIAWENPNEGAGEVEGTYVLYGRRYYMFSADRDGFGYGWYAGFGLRDETSVDVTPDRQSPLFTPEQSVSDESGAVPVLALEIFYKWYPFKNFFVEPGVLFGADSDDGIEFSSLGQVVIGLEFTL